MGLFFDGQTSLIILDNTGEPLYIQPTPMGNFTGNFLKQTVDGVDYLTYHVGAPTAGWTYGTNYVLDDSYTIVDSWTIDNGLGADEHDFLLLDNGNAIQMAYVTIPFDLSPYGGPVNGELIDIVIQEQDANKNVVFEWHGIDHMPIEDSQIDLTTDRVDYLHTNSIEVDVDGNLLLSQRHFSEITKINRQTGEIIWRMGGESNQFTFTNDIGFSFQHDVRQLENGNITMFDNGNLHSPPHSRAIEYEVDETNMTVTRVWQYPEDQSQFSPFMANVQRLSNGNTLIGWGSIPKVTEVLSDRTVVFEAVTEAVTYRAFRFPWSAFPAEPPRMSLQYGANLTEATIYAAWNGATDITGYEVYVGVTRNGMSLFTTAAKSGFETEIPLTGLDPDSCFFSIRPVHNDSLPTPDSNVAFRIDTPSCRDQLNGRFMPIITRSDD